MSGNKRQKSSYGCRLSHCCANVAAAAARFVPVVDPSRVNPRSLLPARPHIIFIRRAGTRLTLRSSGLHIALLTTVLATLLASLLTALLFTVATLLSAKACLLSAKASLLSTIACLLSTVACLLAAKASLLPAIAGLLSTVAALLPALLATKASLLSAKASLLSAKASLLLFTKASLLASKPSLLSAITTEAVLSSPVPEAFHRSPKAARASAHALSIVNPTAIEAVSAQIVPIASEAIRIVHTLAT